MKAESLEVSDGHRGWGVELTGSLGCVGRCCRKLQSSSRVCMSQDMRTGVKNVRHKSKAIW